MHIEIPKFWFLLEHNGPLPWAEMILKEIIHEKCRHPPITREEVADFFQEEIQKFRAGGEAEHRYMYEGSAKYYIPYPQSPDAVVRKLLVQRSAEFLGRELELLRNFNYIVDVFKTQYNSRDDVVYTNLVNCFPVYLKYTKGWKLVPANKWPSHTPKLWECRQTQELNKEIERLLVYNSLLDIPILETPMLYKKGAKIE